MIKHIINITDMGLVGDFGENNVMKKINLGISVKNTVRNTSPSYENIVSIYSFIGMNIFLRIFEHRFWNLNFELRKMLLEEKNKSRKSVHKTE